MSGKIFTGALLVMSMRWIDRLLGFISTLVLARLLAPEDFGIIAMASVVVGLIDVLLDLGVVAMLIHKRDTDDEDFHNAWTIRLIESALVAIAIALTAPLAADYYHDGRITAVLRLMAVSVLVSGFENIGVESFQKDMRFGKDFQFFFLRRFTGFTATLIFALWLQDYWALPLGALAGRIGGVAISYALHPFRPRLTLSRLRSIWSFSQWMMLLSTGNYFVTRLDKFLLGHRVEAPVVGAYSLADDVASMPTTELVMPIGRVLFPAFVQVRDNPVALRHSFLLALGLQALVAVPASIGLALVADEAVRVLLGERWTSAVPFVEILAFVCGLDALTFAAGYVMMSLGKVRAMAIFVWLKIVIFGIGAVALFPQGNAIGIAEWRLAVNAAYTVGFLALVLHQVPGLRTLDMLGALWRPLAGVGIMALILPAVTVSGWPLLLTLLYRCAAGAGIYAGTVLVLWILAGRPRGAEGYIMEKLAPLFRRPQMLPRSPD